MTEMIWFQSLLYGWFGLSLLVFVVLFFLSAPYGRHARGGWGPNIPSTLGWTVMELPAVVIPLVLFAISPRNNNPVLWVFLLMWEAHYIHRTFIYPYRMRMQGKTMAISIAAMAFVTNLGIDYLNARWLFALGPQYTLDWLWDPRFLIGVTMFMVGFAINRHSDAILRNLRKPGETGYKIPQGGMYRWVSSPNYTGELLEWAGWAVATWSLPGLAFAVWSFSNLTPRALFNHQWYQEKFPNYPKERKALIPFLW